MELPPSLAPWAASLDLLPRELAVALGPMVERLDRVIGPMHTASRAGSEEPEGLDGIARRGLYERLLLSEWLLADAAPDEFLRRAATGELSFLQLSRRDPAGSRLSIALVDAGPDQLGGPRIAHIAALVVLARRAASAGLRFSWGVIQKPGDALHEGLDAAGIQQLLNARTHLRPEPGDRSAWRWHVGALKKLEQDCEADLWVVGGAGAVREWAREASCLEIIDPLDADRHELDVVMREAGRTRRAALPLPSPALCSRLIRDPFGQATATPLHAPGALAPLSNPVFGQGSTKLLARGSGGRIIAYPAPNSPSAGAGKPRTRQTGSRGHIISVGRHQKSLFALLAGEPGGELQFRCFGADFLAPNWDLSIRPGEFGPTPGASDPLGVCLVTADGSEMLVQFGARWLIIKRAAEGVEESERVSLFTDCGPHGVVGQRRLYGGPVSLWVQDGDWRALARTHQGKVTRQLTTSGDAGTRAFFGWGGGAEHPATGLAAVERANGLWTVIGGGEPWDVRISPDDEVVGVASPDGRSPGVVTLGPDRRTLTIITAGATHVLPIPPHPIAHAVVSIDQPFIAYTTEAGEVFIYSLSYKKLVYQFAPQPQRHNPFETRLQEAVERSLQDGEPGR